ncbi:hypothetical protein QUF72_09825 [Desulfobacterales bacterium HSG2]|nr:hypothetical protein [Desulfobacterales bacterium HSG2]
MSDLIFAQSLFSGVALYLAEILSLFLNHRNARESASTSEELSSLAEQMKTVVDELAALVRRHRK